MLFPVSEKVLYGQNKHQSHQEQRSTAQHWGREHRFLQLHVQCLVTTAKELKNGTFLLTEYGKALVLHLQRKCVFLGVFNILFSSNMNYIDSNFVGFFFYFYFWRWSLCSFSWFRTQYGPKHPPVLCSWMLQLQAHTTFGKLSGLKDCSVVPKPATTTLPACHFLT